MKGDGGLYQRPRSPYWWMRYSLRGQKYRESTGVLVGEGPALETSKHQSMKMLKGRLKQVGADQIGARTFVTPKNERITVGELLDGLTADMEIREKYTAAVHSQMKPLRE